MVFHGPNRSGRSRHGKPVFAMKTTAFKKCRFDNSAGRPGRSRSGGSRCLIRTQSTAVSSCRRITTVDHETIFPSIPQRQAITVLRDFPANPTSGCPSLRTRPSTSARKFVPGLNIVIRRESKRANGPPDCFENPRRPAGPLEAGETGTQCHCSARSTRASLDDHHRSGRPESIPVEVRCELMMMACDRPPEIALRDIWTYASLSERLMRSTGWRLSQSEIGRILRVGSHEVGTLSCDFSHEHSPLRLIFLSTFPPSHRA